MKWQPISEAPYDTQEMFIVKAFNVQIGAVKNYTSDAYATWASNGKYPRWPHTVPPTHFCYLPKFEENK